MAANARFAVGLAFAFWSHALGKRRHLFRFANCMAADATRIRLWRRDGGFADCSEAARFSAGRRSPSLCSRTDLVAFDQAFE